MLFLLSFFYSNILKKFIIYNYARIYLLRNSFSSAIHNFKFLNLNLKSFV